MSALFGGIRMLGGFRSVVTFGCLLATAAPGLPLRAQSGFTEAEDPVSSVLVPSAQHHSGTGPWESQAAEASIGDGTDFANSCTCCDGAGSAAYGDGCRADRPHDAGWANTQCEPPGLLQRIVDHHANSNACWIGRADALILWRNAPPDRPILENNLVVGPILNANGMDSTAAAGPRFSIFRSNECTGHAVEVTYLRAANFRSMRPLSAASAPYVLAAPGIYGNNALSFSSGDANLGSRVQSLEVNRHHCHGKYLRFLAGFRWIDWQEQFTLQGTAVPGPSDLYQTTCFNDLYGGQIGLDANLLATSWIRFDGLIKAGVYYNNAVQSSEYSTANQTPSGAASVTIDESPVSGAFAGELGVTGVVPVTRNIDVRIGYFGLWLSGVAQPTQQLSGQQLSPGQPVSGTINANGGVVLQGVSLGLEGRW